MTKIKITQATGKWVVRAGGAVLGESADALELTEDGHPMIVYFPRGDLAMAFLDASDHVTTCPHKGEARHFSIVTKSKTLPDAAWSYETPRDDVAQIAGHIAFHATDEVAVEKL